MKTINYKRIADAIQFYSQCGFKYIEVPWLVSLDTVLITRPAKARLFSTFAGELVASGEQSFLEIKEQLAPGKYQCVTPCFRDEQTHDELHLQYFMKNELIIIPGMADNYYKFLDEIVETANDFFQQYAETEVVDVPVENSIINKDICINNIEVGSYGLRKYQGLTWLYGTGLAEPRMTQALNV